MSKKAKNIIPTIGIWRLNLARGIFILIAAGLAWRLADIEVINPGFLRHQGNIRHIRDIPIAAHRGMIVDRNGSPLAVSTPVSSIWMNPSDVKVSDQKLIQLAGLLGLDVKKLKHKIQSNQRRQFVYLKRKVPPEVASKVKALHIPGIALQGEYKRYYPAGAVTSHVVGFTNIDDVGQEGLELTYDALLAGHSGVKRVAIDLFGNAVEGGELIRPAKPGKNIHLSIDLRIQYLAYQALKEAVEKNKAKSATAVVMDVRTGEVLAMVNEPSFNPNNRKNLKPVDLRNRAAIDLFEPGSTVKPFTVISGLKSGKYTTKTIIDTHPGYIRVSGHDIRDHRDYGDIDLATLIEKSSNVGATKIALSLDRQKFWHNFSLVGFGQSSGAYFPGEVMGRLPDPMTWHKLDVAAMSFGYGMLVSALQLTRAYTVLGSYGVLRNASLIKLDKAPEGKRIFSADLVKKVIPMMERVTLPGGTATRADVNYYHVAGKTGTTERAVAGGYSDKHHQSVFAGLIPATNPRLAMVIMVSDPSNGAYFGGLVAAPVFAKVMTGAMRLLNIPPDNLPVNQLQVAAQ